MIPGRAGNGQAAAATGAAATGAAAAGGADCSGDACITCSDAAVPVRIRELLDGGLAVVETDAGTEEVSVALVDARVGDVVLVHAKEALAVLGDVS